MSTPVPVKLWLVQSARQTTAPKSERNFTHNALRSVGSGQQDIVRAVRAVIIAGLSARRVRVTREGSIVIDTDEGPNRASEVETQFLERRRRDRR